MKKIKIKFSGFWSGFDYKDWLVYKILNKHYDVEVCDDADYIICSCFGGGKWYNSFFEYLKYPQVRIMYSGENYTPDFNLVDYAISIHPITYGDRHFYFPCFTNEKIFRLAEVNRDYKDSIISEKPFFANFIFSHESDEALRGDFFKKLCEYKRVESAGSYLNNMENGSTVKYADKLNFQKKSKFTLCFESTKYEGFVTEKIVDAFLADTVPVYYGSDNVKDIFNPKAFINVADFESFDSAIARIIELDNDDRAYLDMLRQPILNDNNLMTDKLAELEAFLCHIFDQPTDKAYRRSRWYLPQRYERYIIRGNDIKNRVKGIIGVFQDVSFGQLVALFLGKISKPFRRGK